MYTTGTVPLVGGTALKSSAVIHPTLLRGMANSIAASTLTNTAVTRTTGVIGPTVINGGLIGGTALVGNAAINTGVIGEIPGESRVEYVPYEKKIIEYEPVERTEYVPYERKVIEYEERKRVEQVPVEKTYTDYYAIEHITEYYPQVIPQTKIDYVPVERIENRVQYYPVERQVVHYPDEVLGGSRRHTGVVGGVVHGPSLIGGVVPGPSLIGGVIPRPSTIGLSRVASGGITTIGSARPSSSFGTTFPYGVRPTSAYNRSVMPVGLTSATGGYTSIGGTLGSVGTGTTVVGSPMVTGPYYEGGSKQYLSNPPYLTTTSPTVTEIRDNPQMR